MDADMSVPVEFVRAFVEEFENDASVDVLVGNRQHGKSVIGERQSWLRESLGKGFNVLVRLLSVSSLRDTQCGFKAFRREAAEAVFTRTTFDGFACDVEILMLASRMGFVVRDLPVQWNNSPESRVRMVRDSARMFADLLRVRGLVERSLAQRPFPKREPSPEGRAD
jgi:dolichyl-phosphate beta-glucosyltransferase